MLEMAERLSCFKLFRKVLDESSEQRCKHLRHSSKQDLRERFYINDSGMFETLGGLVGFMGGRRKIDVNCCVQI